MKFLVVTLAPTLKKDDGFYSYAPYVYEMNLWAKHVDEFGVISPISYSKSYYYQSLIKNQKFSLYRHFHLPQKRNIKESD